MKEKKKSNKQKSMKISRRGFLYSATAAAAFTIVPRHVMGGPGQTPPSDKLNIASIGAGGRASSSINACAATDNIVALSEVDRERGAATFEKYPNAKIYSDYREMLEKQKDIEAVIIATPDHIHAPAAMMAMKLGKHVYVEKPLTHTVYEARKLTETARETGVATQMGNQGHTGESVPLVCKIIEDGAIGPVREVLAWTDRPIWPQGIYRPRETPRAPRTMNWDLWLGPAPYRPYHTVYAPFNWRGWWDFGCGALGDMACHILDHIYSGLKLGYPTSVESCTDITYAEGSYMQKNTIEETVPAATIVHYKFPARGNMPPLKLTWYDGGLTPPWPEELDPDEQVPTRQGTRRQSIPNTIFIGEKGKLMAGQYGTNLQLFPKKLMDKYVKPDTDERRGGGDGAHQQSWIQACKGGEPATSNFDYSGPFTEVVLLGNLAIRAGRKLYWDGANMKVTNESDANKWVTKEYRKGWEL
ncbi:Gfo/Idh/MocA family protein [candidate division KSB1 bacterium]